MCRRHHPHAPPRPSGVRAKSQRTRGRSSGFCAKSRRTRGRSLRARRRSRRRDGRGKSLTLVRLLPHSARRSGRPSLVTIVVRDLRKCQGPKGREDSPGALGGRARAEFDLRCGGASFPSGLEQCLCPSLSLSPSPPLSLSLHCLLALCTSPSLLSYVRVFGNVDTGRIQAVSRTRLAHVALSKRACATSSRDGVTPLFSLVEVKSVYRQRQRHSLTVEKEINKKPLPTQGAGGSERPYPLTRSPSQRVPIQAVRAMANPFGGGASVSGAYTSLPS